MRLFQHAHVHTQAGGDAALRNKVLSWLHKEQHTGEGDTKPGAEEAASETEKQHIGLYKGGIKLAAQHRAPAAYTTLAEAFALEDCREPAAHAPCHVANPGHDLLPAYKRAVQLWKKWKNALKPDKINKVAAKIPQKHPAAHTADITQAVSTMQLQQPCTIYRCTAPRLSAAAAAAHDPSFSSAGSTQARLVVEPSVPDPEALPASVATAYRSTWYSVTPSNSSPPTPRAMKPPASPATPPTTPVTPSPQLLTASLSAAPLAKQKHGRVEAAAAMVSDGLRLHHLPRQGLSNATAVWHATAPAGTSLPVAALSHMQVASAAQLWTESSGSSISTASNGPHTPAAVGFKVQDRMHSDSSTATAEIAAAAAHGAALAQDVNVAHPATLQRQHQQHITAPLANAASSIPAKYGAAFLQETLAGTAMTAYPAVAAALQEPDVCAGPWLTGKQRNHDSKDSTQPAAAVARWNSSITPTTEAATATSTKAGNVSPRSYVSRASLCALRETADVSRWLLRTALLEDELQGRALEVRDQLDELTARKEEKEVLLHSMEDCRASASSAVRQQRPHHSQSDATRHNLLQELNSITAAVTQLAARAASLGVGLACLQGCQTVMHGSKGARLTPASKLAVLQLVLGDVVARLPQENLHELEVCQGLPMLDSAAQQRCHSAGAGQLANIAGSVVAASLMPALPPAPTPAEVIEDGNGCTTLVTFDTAHAAAADGTATHKAAAAVMHQQQQVGVEETSCLEQSPVSHAVDASLATYQASSDLIWSGNAAAELRQQREFEEQFGPHPYNTTDHGSADDDQDDDVIVTLSSVLSASHYTPRPSLAYESRRASVASAAASLAASASASSAGKVTGTPSHALNEYYSWSREGSDKVASSVTTLYSKARASMAAQSDGGQQQQQQQAGAAVPVKRSSCNRSSLPNIALPPWPDEAASPPAAATKHAAATATAVDAHAGHAGKGGLGHHALAAVPEDAEAWYSVAGSSISSNGSIACLTAASQAAELEQALAMYSTNGAAEAAAADSAASVSVVRLSIEAIKVALGAHDGPGVMWPHAHHHMQQHAAAQLRPPVAPAASGQRLAKASVSQPGRVQQLVEARPDIGSMTVGQLLRSLTLAVVQKQRQSVAS